MKTPLLTQVIKVLTAGAMYSAKRKKETSAKLPKTKNDKPDVIEDFSKIQQNSRSENQKSLKVSDYFDPQSKKDDKEHFDHLIQIAKADGAISQNELNMLYRFGIKKGFTNPEIDNLIVSAKLTAYNPPYELSKRFEQIYDIVKMVLADAVIKKNELHLAYIYAMKSGFQENEIPDLMNLLINGIKEGKEEETLFNIFKKGRGLEK